MERQSSVKKEFPYVKVITICTIAFYVILIIAFLLASDECIYPNCYQNKYNTLFCVGHHLQGGSYKPYFRSDYSYSYSDSDSTKGNTSKKSSGYSTYLGDGNSKSSSSDKKYYGGGGGEFYDVYEYDNPDAYAEEWAEEFGDDGEDGYDDAYAYWEDYHDE